MPRHVHIGSHLAYCFLAAGSCPLNILFQVWLKFFIPPRLAQYEADYIIISHIVFFGLKKTYWTTENGVERFIQSGSSPFRKTNKIL